AVVGAKRRGGDEAEFPEGMSANDGGVGTDCGAAFDERPGKFALTLDSCARVVDVREHAAWSAEDLILQLDAVIEADIVLNLTAVAHPDGWADHHILVDGAIFANLAVP